MSVVETLHEMSNPVFLGKQEKYHPYVVCLISQENVKVNVYLPLKDHASNIIADNSQNFYLIYFSFAFLAEDSNEC